MRKKLLSKVMLLLAMLLAGAGNAWAAEYEELFTVKSADVVSNSGYNAYTTTIGDREFVITYGGNNTSVGTNSNKRNNCNLSSYSQYAVSPVTTSSTASAFACKTSVSDVSKISYTISGGSNQDKTKVYLLYSSDGETFSQVTLTSGEQGKTISSGTAYTFDTKTGYFALLFVATNTSGNWRIDDVNITFYKEATTFEISPISNNTSYGTVSIDGNKITATPATGYRVSPTTPYEVTSGSATVSQDGNVFTVSAASDCTIQINFEVVPTYTVTIETPTGGTLVVKNGDDVVATGETVEEGTVLTVEVTPAADYNYKNWQYKLGDGSWTTKTTNYQSPNVTDNISFRANFEAKVYYDVTWSVNGTTTTESNTYEEGDAIVFPANPDAISGKEFVGWSETSISGTTNTTPSFVSSPTMGKAPKTFYAVFADVTKGDNAMTTDDITFTLTGVEAKTNYSDWSGKTSNSSAVYAGQSAGENSTIQLRSKESNSGIVTTTSGGKLKKIVVEWNSKTTDKRVLDIYAKNTAYTAATDLYSGTTPTAGTKIGAITYGTSTELTISGDYTYVGIRSNSGALYLDKVSITWENGTPDTYSNYCTTVQPKTATITINAACTDGNDNYYGTFYTDRAYEMDDMLEGYIVSVDSDGKLVVDKVYEGGDVVPANTPLLIYALEDGDYEVAYTTEEGDDRSEYNDLKGTLTADEETQGENCLFYRLSVHDGDVGFYWGAENGGAFVPGANKAYLPVPTSVARQVKSFSLSDLTDAISEVAQTRQRADAYNLMGQRVQRTRKGIVIVNGKKYINK